MTSLSKRCGVNNIEKVYGTNFELQMTFLNKACVTKLVMRDTLARQRHPSLTTLISPIRDDTPLCYTAAV